VLVLLVVDVVVLVLLAQAESSNVSKAIQRMAGSFLSFLTAFIIWSDPLAEVEG
jgi:uncharacterized membrane protein required for colicin V production